MYYLYKYRIIQQNGDNFEGKLGYIMNNDGTVSYGYKQGVTKYSNGLLLEGSRINSLLNGKVNFKWQNGDKENSEMLNDKWHGPALLYYFDGKVKMDYYSNGEQIFLL